MIRILFISRINLLAGRTNAYNLAKTCEAVNAQENFHAKLVTTDHDRDRNIFFRKMGIRKPFDIVCLRATSTISSFSGKRWYELITFLLVNIRLGLFLLIHAKEFDAVYFRDESVSPAALLTKIMLRKKVFFEIHSVLKSKPRQLLNKGAVRFVDGVIAISSGLKRYYQKTNNNILLSLCSAAEESWFDYSASKSFLREQLGLPTAAYLLGYAGVVGANPNNDFYEVDDIVKSLALLPTNITCVIVGELNGNAEWLRDVAEKSGVKERVIVVPWQERDRIPKYLQAFDINLIPKRKKNLIGDSPAKMFPALVARQPIIAGRAECIEEVLTNGADALIVEYNHPNSWAKAILKVYKDKNLAKKLSDQAWLTKDKYTWEKRGIAIAEFIKKTMEVSKSLTN